MQKITPHTEKKRTAPAPSPAPEIDPRSHLPIPRAMPVTPGPPLLAREEEHEHLNEAPVYAGEIPGVDHYFDPRDTSSLSPVSDTRMVPDARFPVPAAPDVTPVPPAPVPAADHGYTAPEQPVSLTAAPTPVPAPDPALMPSIVVPPVPSAISGVSSVKQESPVSAPVADILSPSIPEDASPTVPAAAPAVIPPAPVHEARGTAGMGGSYTLPLVYPSPDAADMWNGLDDDAKTEKTDTTAPMGDESTGASDDGDMSSVENVDPDVTERSARMENAVRKKRVSWIKIAAVALIIGGAALLLSTTPALISTFFPQDEHISYAETDTYAVPDGLLQSGTIDSGTDVSYVYDLAEGDEPYAVEFHAQVAGFPSARDLYAEWDGESAFMDSMRGADRDSDVMNWRKIIVHLPSDAKGSVTGDYSYDGVYDGSGAISGTEDLEATVGGNDGDIIDEAAVIGTESSSDSTDGMTGAESEAGQYVDGEAPNPDDVYAPGTNTSTEDTSAGTGTNNASGYDARDIANMLSDTDAENK